MVILVIKNKFLSFYIKDSNWEVKYYKKNFLKSVNQLENWIILLKKSLNKYYKIWHN